MIDWRLPVVTLPECSDPAALEAKYQEEWREYKAEPHGSLSRLVELWDVLQCCFTWLSNGGGDKAIAAYNDAKVVMQWNYGMGRPVMDAKQIMLMKNATRPRPGGGTGYYSPEVCAEIMAGKWGEK